MKNEVGANESVKVGANDTFVLAKMM